jgi:hypothetical protein
MLNDVWLHGMVHHEFIAFLSGGNSIAATLGHIYLHCFLPSNNLQNIGRVSFRSWWFTVPITNNNGRHYMTIQMHSDFFKDFTVTDMHS